MGKAADPRLTLRLSAAEHASIDSAAAALGVETGGLAKAAALRGLAGTVAEVESGRLRLRRRSGLGGVEGGPNDPRARVVPTPVPAVAAVAPGPGMAPVGARSELEAGVRRAIAFRRAAGRL